jgi:hypothetical protein
MIVRTIRRHRLCDGEQEEQHKRKHQHNPSLPGNDPPSIKLEHIYAGTCM